MTNQAVKGIVENRSKAEKVIKALADAGVPHQSISFLSIQNKNNHESEVCAKLGATSPNTIRNWRTEERLTDFPAGTTPEERYNSAGMTSVGRGAISKASKQSSVDKDHQKSQKPTPLPENAILISVRTFSEDLAKKAKDVLQKNGAEDISISTELKTGSKHQ